MKSKEMGIMIAFGVITGMLGFFAGSSGADDAAAESAKRELAALKAEMERRQSAELTATSSGVNTRGYELSRDPERGLEELIEELKRSPMAMMDFESMFNIWDMVQYLDAYEIEGLLASLEEAGGGQEMMAVRMILLNRLAAKDGPAAVEVAMGIEQPMLKMSGLMGAMMGWMRNAPDDAYNWIEENGDKLAGGFGMGKERFEAMYYAVKARTDFDGTMAKIEGLDESTQSTVIEQLAQNYASDGEKRAQLISYLQGKNTETLHEAQDTMVRSLVWQDPEQAVALLDEFNPAAERRAELEEQLGSSWGRHDPAAALEWQSETLQGQENAGDEIAGTFARWVGNDEAQASDWLRNQGDEFHTDAVYEQAGSQLLNSQPERAAEWYGQVLDDSQRQSNYEGLYETWKGQDEEAANQWLNSLPEADRAAALGSSSEGE
ncbi:MAG: hypothetical protein Q7Q71_05415 [Verrucomicrobiota bacterium JB023]|nr:hypothetical protein [Verrucomicrobiota bacterium JB023]